MLGSLAFTVPPGETPAPDTGVLLSIADELRHLIAALVGRLATPAWRRPLRQ